jgi:hypothetical protein
MSSVVENYKTAYEEQHHAVEKIRVGLPVCNSSLTWLVLRNTGVQIWLCWEFI